MSQNLQAATDATKNAGAATNPLIEKQVKYASDTLDKIHNKDYSGLPLVSAINSAAERMRAFQPKPSGEAALAASAAGNGGGYAQQQEAYRRRVLDNQVGNLVPEAVQAEEQNAKSTLFPGAEFLSNFDLARAGQYLGNTNSAASIYNANRANSFGNQFKGAFASALGKFAGGGNISITKAFGGE